MPYLATSWQRAGDGSYTLALRRGVHGVSGDPFTAADVRWSLERAAARSPVAPFLLRCLVERRRDCVDRRRHIVAITCAGRARLAAVEQASAAAEERLLAGLDAAQRAQLAALLRLVRDTTKLSETCPGTAAESERSA